MKRGLIALAALFTIVGITRGAARAQDQGVKPYIIFTMDVSGSMDTATGFGPPSCAGSVDTRFDHAKCAIQNIANGYGEMVLALGRYRESTTDTNPADGCSMTGINCSACDNSTGANCTTAMSADDRFELLVPLTEGNQAELVTWNNFTAGTCTNTIASNPELFTAGWTPIAGALKGAKRYLQGLQGTLGTTLWPSGSLGFDPIRNDPLKNIFVPSGEQCRPYIVIQLTDGDETCTTFANTQAAATSLLTTVVDGQTYKIYTKPIGFGQSPGDTQIEGLAHAGGAPDVSGVNEGYYAQNEEELSIAISQIIADALKFETCNDLDDDCDLLIDEDFPNKGNVCDNGLKGICKGTGNYICSGSGTGLTCNITNPGGTAVSEICGNGLDDDCDGVVDENCTGCGTVELCDGIDNNCNGQIDENLIRDCGSNVGECKKGTQTCSMGVWGTCTGTGPKAETCDGKDNDCNGSIDGFIETCSSLMGGNPNQGICRPGTRVCPSDGSGVFGPCIGEVLPQPTEACDLLDNDCDGPVDEDIPGTDCSSTCGIGTTVCMNGMLICETTQTSEPEVCDGVDNDCDGQIDEGLPDMGACDEGGTLCVPGVLRCVGGGYQCVGGELPGIEICDCEDNDCDSQIDEEPPALCAPGASCVSCQCAFPCAAGEFPCPLGRYCGSNNFCLLDPCYGVTCNPDGNGDKTQCVEGDCVRSCDLVTCGTGFVCRGSDGVCVVDNCLSFPDRCASNEFCIGGTCTANPCLGVSCTAPEYCQGGTCVGSCASISCGQGERCELGVCVADACGGPCPEFQFCDSTGECVQDPCRFKVCPAGEVCASESNECIPDPCLGVVCPGANEICKQGTCFDPSTIGPDAGVPDNTFVAPGGGGGCSAGGHGNGAGWLLIALGAVLLHRRRREEVR